MGHRMGKRLTAACALLALTSMVITGTTSAETLAPTAEEVAAASRFRCGSSICGSSCYSWYGTVDSILQYSALDVLCDSSSC